MNIEAYWRATLRQDAAAMRGYLSPDAEIRWHCSNECFTAEEFIRANCEYPGDWDGEIERIERLDDLIITAVRVFTRDRRMFFHVTSFIRILDDRIAAIDEYWGDDGPPPQWRLEKKIGRKIRD